MHQELELEPGPEHLILVGEVSEVMLMVWWRVSG